VLTEVEGGEKNVGAGFKPAPLSVFRDLRDKSRHKANFELYALLGSLRLNTLVFCLSRGSTHRSGFFAVRPLRRGKIELGVIKHRGVANLIQG
jgi:hypothetical protein